MKRKGGFYNYILVLPCVLLSCLTTVLFWLPPESPAKMVLGMSIFTSFFVLLLLLSKNVPSATDKIPLIGAYYCLNMVMIATSTCACTIVVHIFFRGQGRVPNVIRKIFLEFLARVFCMTAPPVLPPPASKASTQQKHPAGSGPAAASSTIITSVNNLTANQTNGNLIHQVSKTPVLPNTSNNNRLSQTQLNSLSCTALNNEETEDLLNSSLPHQHAQQHFVPLGTPQLGAYQRHVKLHASSSTSNANGHHVPQGSHNQAPNQLNTELSLSFNLIENDIKEIRDYLRHTRKKLETTDAKAKQTNEWKQVALVLDRTLFYLYIIAIIVSVTLMFPRWAQSRTDECN